MIHKAYNFVYLKNLDKSLQLPSVYFTLTLGLCLGSGVYVGPNFYPKIYHIFGISLSVGCASRLEVVHHWLHFAC